jgi:hypothetical protein
MPITGWLGLGWLAGDVFAEAVGYERPAVIMAVGEHASLPRIAGITGPPGQFLTHGGLFDAVSAGHCLLSWSWAPTRIAVPGHVPAPDDPPALDRFDQRCDFPSTDYMLRFVSPVEHAVNANNMIGGISAFAIEKNHVLGQLNGQIVSAGCRLVLVDGCFHARAVYAKRGAAA